MKAQSSSCVYTVGELEKLSVPEFTVQIVLQLRVKKKISSFPLLCIIQDAIEQLSSLGRGGDGVGVGLNLSQKHLELVNI